MYPSAYMFEFTNKNTIESFNPRTIHYDTYTTFSENLILDYGKSIGKIITLLLSMRVVPGRIIRTIQQKQMPLYNRRPVV